MNPSAFCEALKAMRSEWLTIDQVLVEARSTPNTTKVWLAELIAQGIVRSKLGTKPEGRGGPPPSLYAVTKEWGGVA